MNIKMRELELDYQRKPGTVTRLGMIIFGLACGLLAVTLFSYRLISAESEILETKLHQIERATMPSYALTGKRDSRTLAEEVRQANQILRMMGLRWDSIFSAVADSHRDGVALLALAPEPEKRVVKISAEAKSFAVMLDYVKRLEAQPVLGEVYLQSHTMQNNDPQRPVRFVVTADWLDN